MTIGSFSKVLKNCLKGVSFNLNGGKATILSNWKQRSQPLSLRQVCHEGEWTARKGENSSILMDRYVASPQFQNCIILLQTNSKYKIPSWCLNEWLKRIMLLNQITQSSWLRVLGLRIFCAKFILYFLPLLRPFGFIFYLILYYPHTSSSCLGQYCCCANTRRWKERSVWSRLLPWWIRSQYFLCSFHLWRSGFWDVCWSRHCQHNSIFRRPKAGCCPR